MDAGCTFKQDLTFHAPGFKVEDFDVSRSCILTAAVCHSLGVQTASSMLRAPSKASLMGRPVSPLSS